MRNTLLQVAPVLFAAILLLTLIRTGRLPRDKIGMRPPIGPWLPLILLFAAYLAILEWISLRSGLLGQQVKPWQFGPIEGAIRTIGIVILTPFVEETIFRGVLQWKLAERFGDRLAIPIQAGIFTAAHGVALIGSKTVTFDIAQLFLESAFYGWTRYRTRSLFPAMIMHGLGNSIAVVERLLL